MDGSDALAPIAGGSVVRDANGRFAAGSLGRPFGSRNRASKRVARAILRDFEAHQDELLPLLRRWHMPQYLALVARLLPRVNEEGGVEIDAPDEVETARVIAEVRAALALVEDGRGGLEALESALLGEGRHNSGAVAIGDYR